ncbi:MAG TPA: hypothetical protein VN033_14045 [Vulgatibacter sp.]|nr:hypothetical protein [Vulgatibacter sp.]
MCARKLLLPLVAAICLLALGLLPACGGSETQEPDEPDLPDPTCSVDCAALAAPPCQRSVCNDGSLPGDAGSCVTIPVEDGSSCDDGDACTVGDACVAGACVAGMRKDCSEMDGACTAGACDPADGSCKANPVNEGGACDDGSACTVGDSCVEGVCIPGQALDCSSLDSDCTRGTCDPNEGACVGVPLADGTSCDDGDSCTTGDSCRAGVCTSGAPKDCSGFDSACATGACDPAQGACVAVPKPSSTLCDDGDPCTLGDFCLDGYCRGVPRNCSALDSACSAGVCNPADGTCGIVPRNDGTPCDAIDLCAAGGVCQDGTCVGGDRVDCSSLDSECTQGVCDPSNGSCKAVAINEGSFCYGGDDACRVNTICTAGVCGGGQPPPCSMTADGCCPTGCTHTNDVDCPSCQGIEVDGTCVYMPSTMAASDKTSATATCTALGPGWALCPPAVLCQPAALQYLAAEGCDCAGGASTCACSATQNLYIHVDNGLPRAHYVRDSALFPSCIASSACTSSGSETCGTPLCCKPL